MVTQGMALPSNKTFLNYKWLKHYFVIVIVLYSPDVVLFIVVVDGQKKLSSLTSASRFSWHRFWHPELVEHFSFPLHLLAQKSALSVSSGH